ncbi:cytochrome c1 [Gluconobacter kanchanaburiensis]|uniref:Cytochrome c1 n=1 Tax=Gluconobacter kanchanaburiensis NBRC 103587 TaxID=1307948 RepID=A0A511B498_9PROT|nr:cytochrome c1 [Gluconobacter kanchanaburiensis]MBF0861610.1 ubiquinol-cytochrome C reductase [Gluconobacter kanchanaburiensis]GBR67083.1 ubiquinol-cytochrome c reductase cytochrome c1 [Gluconobacter kanchanaburiensis NBRC 103587]GEK95255.1 ribosomal protein P2 [Gluconobacter kanchanaburiensis NBRC 103587]
MIRRAFISASAFAIFYGLTVVPASAETPAQRGFAVFQQVCSACHGMEHVHYGDLTALDISSDTLRKWAADQDFPDGVDDNGDPKTRHGTLSDPILAPYPNAAVGRLANHGLLPPDLSRLAMTLPGGAHGIRNILLSYAPTPPGVKLDEGRYYNTALKWKHIGMPPPLQDNMLTYADGTRATTNQMASDVSVFLDRIAHPHALQRRRIGVFVLAYLAVMAVLTFLLQRRIWKS